MLLHMLREMVLLWEHEVHTPMLVYSGTCVRLHSFLSPNSPHQSLSFYPTGIGNILLCSSGWASSSDSPYINFTGSGSIGICPRLVSNLIFEVL